MKYSLPDEEAIGLKGRNRIRKLSPQTHKIAHESGRSTKRLWMQIVEGSKKEKHDTRKNRHSQHGKGTNTRNAK